jgi:hypothetical protein
MGFFIHVNKLPPSMRLNSAFTYRMAAPLDYSSYKNGIWPAVGHMDEGQKNNLQRTKVAMKLRLWRENG